MLRQASRTAIGIRRTLVIAAAALALQAHGAFAVPYRPTDGSTVLLTVSPSAAAIKRAAQDRKASREAQATDLAAALDWARLAIRDGRREADPRRYGQAQAALGPWWSDPNCPTEARVLRAVIRQALHDFSGAAADLDAILERDPDNAQARLSRAFVYQATGALQAAKDDCRRLPARVGRLAAAVCRGRIEALTGGSAAALEELARAMATDRKADSHVRRWAAATAADIAVSLGRPDAALYWYARAIDGDRDIPTLVDYADFLLDAGRPGEAISLLDHDEFGSNRSEFMNVIDSRNVEREMQISLCNLHKLDCAGKPVSTFPHPAPAQSRPVDIVVLRLAIAAKAAGDPRLAEWSALLSEGFALARAAGNELHLREEARFSLEVLGDAHRALDLARRNWAVQKEPADARVLLAAALAAERPQAADEVLAFIEATGLEDIRVMRLVDQLARTKPSATVR
jgi:hypothetical protein